MCNLNGISISVQLQKVGKRWVKFHL